jgi:fatty acid desaturase
MDQQAAAIRDPAEGCVPAVGGGVGIGDPRAARTLLPMAWVVGMLNDPRDTVFVDLMIRSAACALLGIGLFFAGRFLWWLAPAYWFLSGVCVLDRFILMLHCTSHRPLFNPRHRRLNRIVPWLLGPFFGQTPESYFVHHLGMHHREGNLLSDASSTMTYQRDRFDHWLRYVGRFLVVGIFDLLGYFRRRQNGRLSARLLRGEIAFWLVVLVLLLLNPRATVAVFVVPVLVVRVLMMIGNWGQHSFVCPRDPSNPFRSSITCINTRYNRRCFNDGYHIHHHIQPAMHWTEYPAELEANLARYGAEDAIVFDGIDFFGVWLCLMMRRWRVLVRAFVHLPSAPIRTEAEIVALFRVRLSPIDPYRARSAKS